MAIKLTKLLFIILSFGCADVWAFNPQPSLTQSVNGLEKEFIHVHLNSNFFVAGESLLFKVYCTDAQGRPSNISTMAYVEFVGENGNVLAQLKVRLTDGAGSGDFFFGGSVPTGNYNMIVYTKWMRNFGLEGVSRHTLSIVNPSVRSEVTVGHSEVVKQITSAQQNSHIALKVDGLEFGLRQKVVVQAQADTTCAWNLSVNVRRHHPGHQPMEWKKNADSKFDSQTLRYYPDVRGELITGVVTLKGSGQPAVRKLVTLSSPSDRFDFLVSTTDATGRYYFHVREMEADVALMDVMQSGRGEYEIIVDNNFMDNPMVFTPQRLKLDTTLKREIEQRSLYAQVENAFYAVKKDSTIRTTGDTRFFAVPDKRYDLDDFTRFPTMEDVFREIIPEVVVKSRDSKFSLTIANLVTGERLFGQPLLLIDGVPISDPNLLMKYDPLKVKTISLSTRHYFYGGLETDGIVSLETYDGNAGNVSVDRMFSMPYVRPSLPKKYYSPEYPSELDLSRVPDFRTQLYWNSSLSIPAGEAKVVEFYTCDIPGQYVIEVVGMSETGEKMSWTKVFFVK